MEQILSTYYADNAKKLHKVVDKILLKFGGLSDKDLDDFYSLANEVFVDVMAKYDDSQSFDGFLYSCLLNKIKTEMTRRNREKRKADRMSISIDAPIGDNENSTIINMKKLYVQYQVAQIVMLCLIFVQNAIEIIKLNMYGLILV